MNNIPTSIVEKFGRCLYQTNNHPICIVKEMVFDYFSDLTRIEIDNPYVSVENNFNRLRIPLDHPSRQASDTFYKNEQEVLRTHMTSYLYPLGSAHNGNSSLKYIICGDVYRKDAIDATHYPVFHQIDAFCIVPNEVDVKQDLRNRLSGLIAHLFGPSTPFKFLEDKAHQDVYFPFTVDSLEAEATIKVDGQDKHIELLGAGTVHPDIMKDLGLPNQQAWAFGLGIERLAMIMFGIPDIRLFWSTDERFLSQFTAKTVTKFRPFSKQEVCYKDISFFISPEFTYNDMCTIARDEDKQGWIESITLIDEFQMNDITSHCYRIVYRSMDRSLKNTEINKLQIAIRDRLISELKVKVR
jgi:phenylalanyl-tRNA synthetase alpha chain